MHILSERREMVRTPDAFPGLRHDEGLVLDDDGIDPLEGARLMLFLRHSETASTFQREALLPPWRTELRLSLHRYG